MKRLIREAHRRSLWQVLSIYIVGGWIAYQVVQSLTEGLELPGWFPALAIVLLVVGLPIVLATAFVQEGGPTARALTGAGARPFADPVRQDEAAGSEGAGPPPRTESAGAAAAAAHHRLFTWRNAILGGVGAFAVWGVVATVWLIWQGGAPVPSEQAALPGVGTARASNVAAIAARGGQDLPAVAVLPFADMGSDDEYAFFADGVHEDILTNLSKVRGLIVLSRSTMLPYRDNERPLSDVAEELNADAFVEGSVRRFGDQVRISAQLTDPASGATLWAESYDRNLDDIFAVQSEIAIQVAGALEAVLTPAEQARIAAAPTADLTAYDLYKRGRQLYYEYQEESNERAIQLFREALAADSALADAWAGLADAYAQTVSRWAAGLAWADSAALAARQAVALAPESSIAYKALALALSQQGRTDESMAANERALELDPNNGDAANNLALGYQFAGRIAEAAALYKLSDRLNPQRGFAATNLAFVYTFLGLSERHRAVMERDLRLMGAGLNHLWSAAWQAVADGDRDSLLVLAAMRVEMDPTNADFRAESADWVLKAGNPDLAETQARAALRLSQHAYQEVYKPPLTLLGEIALTRGDTAEGHRLLAESLVQARELDDSGYASVWNLLHLGMIHALLGETDAAFETLDRVVALRGSNVPFIWEVESAFDSIRDDPRFEALMEQVRAHNDRERAALLAQEGG